MTAEDHRQEELAALDNDWEEPGEQVQTTDGLEDMTLYLYR